MTARWALALLLLASLPWVVPSATAQPRSVLRAHPRARAPVRRGVRVTAEPEVDVAVLLDLAAAALAAGAAVPGALVSLGEAVGGAQGPALRRAGSALLLGASWAEAWSAVPAGLRAVGEALEPAWVDGVPAGPLLTRAADHVRADRDRAAHEAAARLGVRLVLPLGLCLLPAFVLLGLVPVLLSTGGGLFG